MPTYSPSSLTCFETCQKQYEFRYVKRVKPPQRHKPIAFFVGSMVHETLEWLYGQVLAGIVPKRSQLIAWLRKRWDAETPPEHPVHELEEAWERTVGILTRFYEANHPFDRDVTLGLELPVRFTLTDDVVIFGFIDRLARRPDGGVEIHDYKTSRWVPRREQLDQDRQLGLYQIGVLHTFNVTAEKVKLVWLYLDRGLRLVSHRTQDQLTALAKRTVTLARTIVGTKVFPTRKGGHCKICDYKSICPAWAGRR